MKTPHTVDAVTLPTKAKRVLVGAAVAAAVVVSAAPTVHVTGKALHDTCWGRFCRPVNTR